jgi:hypothetical protein
MEARTTPTKEHTMDTTTTTTHRTGCAMPFVAPDPGTGCEHCGARPTTTDGPDFTDTMLADTMLEAFTDLAWMDEDEISELPESVQLLATLLDRVQSFEQGGWMTTDAGLAIDTPDRRTFTVTVTRAR